MHLVFATSIVPDGAPASGYEIANAAIIDALRRAGVRVTVIGFTWPGKAPADPENTVVLGSVDVRTDSASRAAEARLAGASGVRGRHLLVGEASRREPRPVARRHRRRSGRSTAMSSTRCQFAGAFEGLFDDKPSIFVAHNVEFRSAEENAAAARGPFQKLPVPPRGAAARAHRAAPLCDKAAFVFTLADEDRAALGVDAPGKSAALPLVTPASTRVAPANRSPTDDAALIGTWTWQPNRIGLEWFLEKVVPHLPDEFRIAIAGKHAVGHRASRIRASASSGALPTRSSSC